MKKMVCDIILNILIERIAEIYFVFLWYNKNYKMLKKGWKKTNAPRVTRKSTNTRFAKKVMAVVNKKAEIKENSVQTQFVDYSNTLNWTAYNLVNNLARGTNSSQFVGDKIYLKGLRIALACQNTNSLGGGVHGDAYNVRVVVFKGKYDYNLTNYPLTEVFEGNAGSTPLNYMLARIDRSQVTPIMDRTIFLREPSLNTTTVRQIRNWYLRLNQTLRIRDDDVNGKTSNIYVGLLYQCGQTQTSAIQSNYSLIYTDV